MKKLLVVLLSLLMVFSFTACGKEEKVDDKTIDKLTVAFVPSKDADVILTAAEPLKELLKNKLMQLKRLSLTQQLMNQSLAIQLKFLVHLQQKKLAKLVNYYQLVACLMKLLEVTYLK